MKVELQQSVEILCNALREDKELYYAYQANIAMAFKDAYDKEWRDLNLYREGVPAKVDLHKVANDAAKNFLDLLIKK